MLRWFCWRLLANFLKYGLRRKTLYCAVTDTTLNAGTSTEAVHAPCVCRSSAPTVNSSPGATSYAAQLSLPGDASKTPAMSMPERLSPPFRTAQVDHYRLDDVPIVVRKRPPAEEGDPDPMRTGGIVAAETSTINSTRPCRRSVSSNKIASAAALYPPKG